MKKLKFNLKQSLLFLFLMILGIFGTTGIIQAAPGSAGIGKSFLTSAGFDVVVPEIEVNGEKGYCLNFDLNFPTGEEYRIIEEAYTEPSILGALFYGYGGADNSLQAKYGIPDEQASYATNIVIWRHAHDLGVASNSGSFRNLALKPNAHPNLLDYLEELATKRFNPTQAITLSFSGNTNVENGKQVSDWIVLSNAIAYDAEVYNGATLEVKEGNRFKISVPTYFSGNVGVKVIPTTRDFKALVWRTGGNTQDIVKFNKKDPLPAVNTTINFKSLPQKIEILKVDEKGKAVPGVVFEQSTKSDFSSDNWEITTGADGIARDTWNRGGDIKVYVREKSVPKHLVKSNEVKQIVLKAGTTQKLQFTNQIKKGKIALSKQMDKNINGRTQDGLKVAGSNIEFDIVDKNGNVVETIKTNDTGYAESNLLEYGQYTVKEKASDANKGYKLVKDFVVDIKENNKVYHYALENFIKQSKLKIVKTDAESKETVALAGFEFKLKDEQGNFVKQVVPYPAEKEIDVFTTDESGTVQLPENLVFGKYKVVEINTPKDSGYVLSDAELEVDITGDETILTVEFENQKQKLIVELEKFAEQLTKFEKDKQVINGKEYEVTVPKFEEKYLAGVTFELREKNGTVLQRKTTTADAKLVFDPVNLGKYDLVEVETVTGYVLNSKPVEVVGTAQEQTIQFDIQSQKVKNDKQTYKVNFKKVLENSEHFKKEKAEAYKEVVFGLYTKQDLNINGVQIAKDTLVGVTGLNEKFEGNFDLMFAGEFYVKELATNQSYVLNEENTEVKVEASTDKKEVVTKIEKPIENKLKRVSIQLIKVDRLNHNKTLEGAEFKLISITDAGEKELGTYTTDKNGKIEVDQLETGKYRFIETKASKGYFNSNEKIDLNIDSTVQNNDVIKVQVENDKIFKVHINKIDSLTKEALIDKEVEFTLYDKDMNVLEVKTVDLATGIAIFDVKAQTQYYIKETKAPLGYVLSEEVVSVNLKSDEKDASYTILFENEPVQEIVKKKVETNDTTNYFAYMMFIIISGLGFILLKKNRE